MNDQYDMAMILNIMCVVVETCQLLSKLPIMEVTIFDSIFIGTVLLIAEDTSSNLVALISNLLYA